MPDPTATPEPISRNLRGSHEGDTAAEDGYKRVRMEVTRLDLDEGIVVHVTLDAWASDQTSRLRFTVLAEQAAAYPIGARFDLTLSPVAAPVQETADG